MELAEDQTIILAREALEVTHYTQQTMELLHTLYAQFPMITRVATANPMKINLDVLIKDTYRG